jgi:hypothetical protein
LRTSRPTARHSPSHHGSTNPTTRSPIVCWPQAMSEHVPGSAFADNRLGGTRPPSSDPIQDSPGDLGIPARKQHRRATPGDNSAGDLPLKANFRRQYRRKAGNGVPDATELLTAWRERLSYAPEAASVSSQAGAVARSNGKYETPFTLPVMVSNRTCWPNKPPTTRARESIANSTPTYQLSHHWLLPRLPAPTTSSSPDVTTASSTEINSDGSSDSTGFRGIGATTPKT